jgi:uncharacterized oxidoreductase
MELKNSTILITGGSSGIGLEMVKQLIAQQAKTIIITGRDLSRLEHVKTRFPQVHIFQSDISDDNAISRLFEELTVQFPELNILINNAGIMRNLDLLDTELTIREITSEIEVSLSGSIKMVQTFLPQFLKRPSSAIINVSSGLAFIPFPISPVYSAAKAGLHAYTRVLRLQLKKTGIKVFELAPPATETPLVDAFDGLADPKQNMAVDIMVKAAVQGILHDTLEIKPGASKILKLLSRVAPETMLNFIDKTLQKARAKKLALENGQN